MSRQVEIQTLMITYQRHLQKLKEKEAILGINTPPEILTEIEDLETKIEDLNEELQDLNQTHPSNKGSQKSQYGSIKKMSKSPVDVLVAKIGLSGTIIASLIGLIGIGITAYFSYLGIQTQVKIPLQATQTAEAQAITFIPSIPTLQPSPVTPSTPTSIHPAEMTPRNSPEIQETWLIIKGVYSYHLEDIAVRVTANVNGNEYIYPSSTGARWLEVGPDMPPQRYRLAPTRIGYDVQFNLVGLHEGDEFELISQWVERIVELPFEGYYELYMFHPATGIRYGSISAGIVYEITDEIE